MEQLADFVAGMRFQDLPSEVVHECQRVVLDAIGCALAGWISEKGRISAEVARGLGNAAESRIIGGRGKISSAGAVLANGELINALEYDSLLMPQIHVSPYVLPPALALAERDTLSGQEFILAVVLAHEVASRVASGLPAERTYVREETERVKVIWRPVSGYSSNVFGAAAGAGKALGLDNIRMAHALGVSGYNAPMQVETHWVNSVTSPMTKYTSAGWVAHTGLVAALLAERGYTGDEGVLDGEYSFWRFAGCNGWQPSMVTRNLGREWYIMNSRYKPFPCCGLIHSALDCFITLLDKYSLSPEEIERVHVWLDPAIEGPAFGNQKVRNDIWSQFSVAYTFAATAHRVRPGVEWQKPTTMENPQILRFMEKVSFGPHPDFDLTSPEGPRATPSRVEVEARGQKLVASRTYPPGANNPPETRFSDEKLEEKFRENAQRVLPLSKIDGAIRAVWGLNRAPNVLELMDQVTP